jgi:hypothetical protein
MVCWLAGLSHCLQLAVKFDKICADPAITIISVSTALWFICLLSGGAEGDAIVYRVGAGAEAVVRVDVVVADRRHERERRERLLHPLRHLCVRSA